jgi:hypothetical protein
MEDVWDQELGSGGPPPQDVWDRNIRRSPRDCTLGILNKFYFFGVESEVACNVLTTGLFRIQQSSHKSASTLCLSEHQVKLAEQWVDQDETKDARPWDRYYLSVHHLSITMEKIWGCEFPHTPYFESMKGMLAATQRYKVEERSKAISHDVFILPRRNASIWLRLAQQNEEISWSALSLTCLASAPFYSSPPSLPQKQSFTDFFFFLWGFVSSIVLKRLDIA